MDSGRSCFAGTQSWKLASDAFAHGRTHAAKQHLNRAKLTSRDAHTPVDSLQAPAFVSCSFDVNQAAIDIARVSELRGEGNAGDVVSACEKAESASNAARFSNARYRPFVGLAEAAFCAEVAATSSYNLALASVLAG